MVYSYVEGQYQKDQGWSPWSVCWCRGLAVDYCRPLVAAQPPPSRTLLLSFILQFFCWSICLFLPNYHHHPGTLSFYFLQANATRSLKFRFHIVGLSDMGKKSETHLHRNDLPSANWLFLVFLMYHVFHPWSKALLNKVYSWSAISGSYKSCLAVQKYNCTDYSRVVSGKPHL